MSDLTHVERIYRAKEAERILDENLCTEVMAGIKANALDHLAVIDPTETNKIIRLQATIAVVDSFREGIEAFIMNADGLSEESEAE